VYVLASGTGYRLQSLWLFWFPHRSRCCRAALVLAGVASQLKPTLPLEKLIKMQSLAGKDLARNASCKAGRGMRSNARPQRSTRLNVLATAEVQYFSGSQVSAPKRGKHFLHLDDFSKDELEDMLAKAKLAKSKFYARDESFKPFAGQTMAMVFTKPSARTRVSFETVRQCTSTSAACASCSDC
jgi:hypothetical protein